jgi:hypothetical protein
MSFLGLIESSRSTASWYTVKQKLLEIQKVIAETRRATNYVHFRAKNDFVHTLMNTTV